MYLFNEINECYNNINVYVFLLIERWCIVFYVLNICVDFYIVQYMLVVVYFSIFYKIFINYLYFYVNESK